MKPETETLFFLLSLFCSSIFQCPLIQIFCTKQYIHTKNSINKSSAFSCINIYFYIKSIDLWYNMWYSKQRQYIAASQGRKINSVQRTRQLLIFYKKLTLSKFPLLWIKIHNAIKFYNRNKCCAHTYKYIFKYIYFLFKVIY